MAQWEHRLTGDVDAFTAHVERLITEGSATAQLEGRIDRRVGDVRMVVLVFERYSMAGGNRLSLTIAVIANGQVIDVSAIASGGSAALFWKVNTFGEEAFLHKAVEAVESYRGR